MSKNGRFYQVEWDDTDDFRNPCPAGVHMSRRAAERAARKLAKEMPCWSVRVLRVDREVTWHRWATTTYEAVREQGEAAA